MDLIDLTMDTASVIGATPTVTSSTNTASRNYTIREGRIIRKKKYKHQVCLAIRDCNKQDEDESETVSVPVMVDRSSTCLQWCFLEAWIRVQVVEVSSPVDGGGGGQCQWEAAHVELLQCAPDPQAVLLCLKLVAHQELSLDVFSRTNLVEQPQQVTEILEQLSPGHQRKEIARLVRQLQQGFRVLGDMGTGIATTASGQRITSQRTPHTRRCHLRILERMEHEIPLIKIDKANKEGEERSNTTTPSRSGQDFHCTFSKIEAQYQTRSLLNLPKTYDHDHDHDTNADTDTDISSRVEYLQQKKWPQIRWVLQRLGTLVEHVNVGHDDDDSGNEHKNQNRAFRCLDVGGGRGDLATAIALAFPQAHVTMVDKNKSSLNAGRVYAQELGIISSVEESYNDDANDDEQDNDNQNLRWGDDSGRNNPRMRFICADFQAFIHKYSAMENSNSKENIPFFDVVVALHACGDLSDLALQFAHQIGAKFVICPCCYSKRFFNVEPTWAQYYKDTYYFQNHKGDDKDGDDAEAENSIKTVRRLAELNERPEISQRAMHVINSLRLHALQKQQAENSQDVAVLQTKNMTLEEYENTFSKRNIVLVGAD